jgi:hypothetical protein
VQQVSPPTVHAVLSGTQAQVPVPRQVNPSQQAEIEAQLAPFPSQQTLGFPWAVPQVIVASQQESTTQLAWTAAQLAPVLLPPLVLLLLALPLPLLLLLLLLLPLPLPVLLPLLLPLPLPLVLLPLLLPLPLALLVPLLLPGVPQTPVERQV